MHDMEIFVFASAIIKGVSEAREKFSTKHQLIVNNFRKLDLTSSIYDPYNGKWAIKGIPSNLLEIDHWESPRDGGQWETLRMMEEVELKGKFHLLMRGE